MSHRHHSHHHSSNHPSTRGKMRKGATPITAVGSGYNTFFASAMPSVLNVKSDPGETSVESSVYLCTIIQDVYRALHIDASMTVSSPWGSFSDRLEFVKSLQMNTTSVTILVSARVVRSASTVSNPTFTAPFTSALDLFEQGGDCYVSSLSEGGQFVAAYTFVAYDNTTYQQLTNAADASFSGTGTDFNASFEGNILDIQKNTGVTARFQQRGIGFSAVKLPTPDQFVDFVLNFGTIVLDGPAVMDFSTMSYTSVKGCPSFAQIDNYRFRYVDPTGSSQGYSDFASLALTNKDIVHAVATIYDNYGFVSIDPKLTTFPPNLQYIIDTIGNWREAVDADPTNPNIEMPVIDYTFFALPTAQYSLVLGQLAGTNGGDPFQDVSTEMIARGVRITSVTVHGDDDVDRIVTTYAQNDNDQPTFSYTHGGDGGYSTPTINLGPGEWITQAIGLWGDYMNRLGIETTTQPMIINPQNGYGSSSITWKPPTETSSFVGWSGRAGRFVDALQPMFAQFFPPAWKMPPNLPTQVVMSYMPPLMIPNTLMPADISSRRMPNETDVRAIVERWASANWAVLKEIYMQKGGWERWAQVELARAFQRVFPQPNVLREENVYTVGGKLADITLTLRGEITQVIELKCESLWQDGYGAMRFYNGLLTDMMKITNYPLQREYKPARLWVIGFTIVNTVTDFGKTKVNFRPYTVKCTELVKDDDVYSLYIWYTYRDTGVGNDEMTGVEPVE
jgi:hypothetical protein